MALIKPPKELDVEVYTTLGGILVGNVPDKAKGFEVAWNAVGFGGQLIAGRTDDEGDAPQPQHQVFTREELEAMLSAHANPPAGAQAALPALPWKVIISLVAEWLTDYLSK